jgi:hypothetical protein
MIKKKYTLARIFRVLASIPMDNFIKLIIILALTISSCSETTTLDSDDISTSEERVEILDQQIPDVSRIKDAEFELFSVNGFGTSSGFSVPGGSSLDYRFVIKIDTADIGKWKDGMTKFTPEHYDVTWTQEIVKERKENWLTSSLPTYYTRQGLPAGWSTTVIEFYSEGIVFKRVITN